MSSSRNSHHRKPNFNVGENYEVLDVVGEGAYGVVWYVLKDDSYHTCPLLGLQSQTHYCDLQSPKA